MSDFSPGLAAALAADRAIVFAALDMDTPTQKVRMLIGAVGYVSFASTDGVVYQYVSADPVFGVFSDIDSIEDGIGDEAPSLTLTLIPPLSVDLPLVAGETLQESPVRIWLGAVDPITGLCLDEPYLLLDGLLDVATVQIDENGGRKVDYEITSVFDEFFLANDMARLSDAFHQYLWPGELGLSFVTWVAKQLYFGTEAPDGVTR